MGKLYLLLFLHSISLTLLLFHIYWFFGGEFGLGYTNYIKFKRNKKSKFVKRVSVLIFSIIIFIIILINISQTGILIVFDSPEFLLWANRTLAIAFLYRAIGNFSHFGFTKTFKKGIYATLDSWVYSPIFILMSICQYLLSVID